MILLLLFFVAITTSLAVQITDQTFTDEGKRYISQKLAVETKDYWYNDDQHLTYWLDDQNARDIAGALYDALKNDQDFKPWYVAIIKLDPKTIDGKKYSRQDLIDVLMKKYFEKKYKQIVPQAEEYYLLLAQQVDCYFRTSLILDTVLWQEQQQHKSLLNKGNQ